MLFPLSPLHLFCARQEICCSLPSVLRLACLRTVQVSLFFLPLPGLPTSSPQRSMWPRDPYCLLSKCREASAFWRQLVGTPYPEQHLRSEEVGGGQWPPAVLWTTCRLPEQHAGSLVIPQFVSNYTTGRTSLRPLRSYKFLTQLNLS